MKIAFLILSMVTWTTLVSAAPKPNILWILTDDHRPDALQCYNQATRNSPYSELGYVSSPQADKLAAEGVLFVNAYCNSPACAPSRASMHTGRYPHRNGIRGFNPVHLNPDFARPLFPELLRDAGYETAAIGKMGYHVFQKGQAWKSVGAYTTEIHQNHNVFGVAKGDRAKFGSGAGKGERFYGPDGEILKILFNESTAERDAFEARQDLLRSYTRSDPTLIIGGESPQPAGKTLDGETEAHFERWLDHAGRRYTIPTSNFRIKTGKLEVTGPDPAKPVYVQLGFNFPHTPVLPPKSFRDRFIAKAREIPIRIPEFTKQELAAFPAQLKTLQRNCDFMGMTEEEKQQAIRDYYAFCAYGDDLVGRAVERFKQFSEAQGREWLIIYTVGDHGWQLGEQGIGAKFQPYDKSNHGAVILVSSDKTRFVPGTVHHGFVEYVDFAPTILQATGLERPEWFDGRSLQDSLSGMSDPRDYVIAEIDVYGTLRAYLRSRDFAFSMKHRERNQAPGQGIRFGLDAPRDKVEMALFDLRIDPGERRNVADLAAYKPLADWFRAKLGNIVLGDGRIECNWAENNEYVLSDFATGSHDGKLDIPPGLIPGS